VAKSRKKSESKAPKRRRFVAGLIDGKSMRKAAIDAGYTQSMANDAGRKIMPGAQDEFRDLLGRSIPDDVLIQRISEGLDAKESKIAQYEGKFTDTKNLVAWGERRRYAELIAKLRGYLVERVEIGSSEDTPVNVDLNIRFVDPGKSKKD
jgi:hypothetical protein